MAAAYDKHFDDEEEEEEEEVEEEELLSKVAMKTLVYEVIEK